MNSGNIVKQVKLLPQKVLVIILFLLLWEIAPRIGLVDPIFLPPASVVFSSLYELTISGVLYEHTSISLQRAFGGFAIAAITAIPLGFIVGWFKTFEKYIDPLLQTMRQLPILALFPVFILSGYNCTGMSLGLEKFQNFWSIFLNTVTGVLNVDPLLIKSARSMGVPHMGMFMKVVLPAASPAIFTGLRYAGTVSLIVLVAAEMIGANAGLGFFVINSEAKFAIPDMYAAIVALTILGVVINYLLVGVERSVSKWKEEIVHS